MISFSGFGNSFLSASFDFSTKSFQIASSVDAESTETTRRKPSADSLLADEYIPSTPDSSETSNADAPSKVSVDFSAFLKKTGLVSSFGMSKPDASSNSIAAKMQEIGHGIEKKIYQGIISRTAEENGVRLGADDVLAFRVDGTGMISINAEASKIEGYVSKPDNPGAAESGVQYIEDACGAIESDLNRETASGSTFGDALLKHYAKEMGYDYDAIKGDASFSISFSFRYNDKTGEHEMMNIQIGNKMTEEVAARTAAAAKLAQRKAAKEKEEAQAVAQDAVTETEDESGLIRSGQVSFDEFEQTYQDRYVKPNVRYATFDLANPPTNPGFRIEGDRLVPADPDMTMEEALAKADEYQKYIRGELFTDEPPEGFDGQIGVLKVMYNDYSRDLIGADGLETCALYGWQTQEINGDAHIAQAYRDRIDAESAVLDGWIGHLLDEKDLMFREGESLQFDIDLDGRITLTGGVDDPERAATIEAALNEDETLGRELLLNHVRQDMGNRKHSGSDFTTDPVNSRIIAAEVLRRETGLTLDDIEFDEETITFKDKNGNVDLTAVSKDYMVWHGLYNSFQWDGDAYVAAEPLSVSFTFAG